MPVVDYQNKMVVMTFNNINKPLAYKISLHGYAKPIVQ